MIIKNILKSIYNILYVNICKLLLFLRNSNNKKFKYYFILCAIFKNESNYLREWIEYHKLLGVDHILLYNNLSDDSYFNVLEEYINENYVTLIDWPYERGQISAYKDCFEKYRNDTKWIMFLDLDEFICPKYDTDIKFWAKKYEKYPAVIIYWLMFGTSGKVNFDENSLVIEQYTSCWKSVRNVGKIMFNTDFEPVNIYHHSVFCKIKLFFFSFIIPMINENFKFIVNPGKEKCPSNGSIQINHYWSKCLDEYIRKIEKGDIFSKENEEIRKKMNFFYWHEYRNISEDKTIWRFLIELKIKMYSINLKKLEQ